MQNESLPDTKPRTTIVVLTVFCALFGFVITAFIINANLIQYTTLPKAVILHVEDNAANHMVAVPLKVTSAIPMDTVKTKPVVANVPVIREVIHHENPMFLVWTMLISIMISLAAGVCPYLIAQLIDIRQRFKLSTSQTWIPVMYAFLIIVYLFLVNWATVGYYRPQQILDDFKILLHPGGILDGFVAATVLLICPAFVIIFMNVFATNNIISKKHDKESILNAADNLEHLNRSLRSMLQLLAIIVVFSVLTSSALREAIKATLKIEGYDIFPSTVSYMYGLYFSLFLFMMYIPAYLYLKYQSGRLKIIAAFVKTENKITDDKWVETQLEPLKVDGTVIDHIKLALTLLAPLISSFLPESLHIFT